jgi:hypothetical protein
VHRGREDENLPSDNFWIYRVGSVVLGIRNENSPKPEIVFYKQYADEATAKELMLFLRNTKADKEVALTDFPAEDVENSSDSEWNQLVAQLEQTV